MMSGPVLSALPSVAPQHVGRMPSVTGASQSNPCKDLLSRQCSTCTSLPPLPRYADQKFTDKRWGEDNLIFKCGAQNACGRNNFDCCHSVQDVPSPKYEGYMFPKPMYQDLSIFRCSANNTKRHVPKEPVRELFPTHNPLRKTEHGRTFVLGEKTRKALSEYINKLYQTSRNDLTFQDTTDFMRRKAERDQQYKTVVGDSCGVSTCYNVLNHPDPYPYCWVGGLNRDFYEQPLPTQTTEDEHLDHVTEENPHNAVEKSCDQFGDASRGDDNGCLKTERTVTECSDVDGKGDTAEKAITDTKCSSNLQNDKSDVALEAKEASTNLCVSEKRDSFGPWKEDKSNTSTSDIEPLLLSNVYNFKLPSSLHNADTENEYVSSYTERHGVHHRYDKKPSDYFGPWTALRREKISNSAPERPPDSEKVNGKGTMLPEVTQKQQEMQNQGLHSQRNCWTFRDEKNNLRIPCISQVIGYKNKTDFHTKIHVDHPAPMPDLRDFKRYSKRVIFNGYNSSVFR